MYICTFNCRNQLIFATKIKFSRLLDFGLIFLSKIGLRINLLSIIVNQLIRCIIIQALIIFFSRVITISWAWASFICVDLPLCTSKKLMTAIQRAFLASWVKYDTLPFYLLGVWSFIVTNVCLRIKLTWYICISWCSIHSWDIVLKGEISN